MHRALTLISVAAMAIVALWAWLGSALAGSASLVAPPAMPGLLGRLETARVSYGSTECSEWTGSRWNCGLNAWEWVGPYRGKVSGPDGLRWRPCLWAHPRSHGGRPDPLTITFSGVDLSDGLSGHGAILDLPKDGDAVDFVVRVNGKRRTRVRLTDRHRRKWTHWTVPPSPDDPPFGSVTFEIKAVDPSWRHTCFTAFEGQVSK